MNTIQALSVFGTWLGFGIFGFSVLCLLFQLKYGTFQVKAILEHMGYLPALRWKFLIVGVVSLIVKNTT